MIVLAAALVWAALTRLEEVTIAQGEIVPQGQVCIVQHLEGGIIQGPYPDRDVPESPSPELYDLASDPLERHDLAGEQPERARRMLRELETWFEDVEADRATIDDGW